MTNVTDILKNVTNSLENIVGISKKIFFKKNVQKIWWFLLFFISTSNTCKLSVHWVHLKIVISKKYVSTRHLTWKNMIFWNMSMTFWKMSVTFGKISLTVLINVTDTHSWMSWQKTSLTLRKNVNNYNVIQDFKTK